jgi:HD-GYP domain-containing protein (c-di-GMP phosphodiesterase class II)
MNVSLLNGLIGKWLGLPKETVDMLILVGLLHDCGKVAVPKQLLSAPRPLTVAEFEVVKMHAINSYNILNDFPETIRHGARCHHEKFNGNGYPDGVESMYIPLFARITAVSDIYDAMTARRSYKDPRSPFFVMALLNKLKDTELDPMLVELFLENMPQELIGKQVMMSNGKTAILQEIDPNDLEHPKVLFGGRQMKCDEEFYCKYMHTED